jgi:anaerobic ribonucleoside-triphosphate reductase activating protein
MTTLRVGARLWPTAAEGPGERYALWLQGCSLRCPGCCNPHLFDPAGGESVDVDSLLREVMGAPAEIEGVSILGGEPFDQAQALLPFVRGVRELELGVIVFTGLSLSELQERTDPAVRGVLSATDLLIDGRFDATYPETRRRWVGSANQRFHYLTGRYSPDIERGANGRHEQRLEVRIDPAGRVQLNGWPGRLPLGGGPGPACGRPGLAPPGCRRSP